MSNRSMPRREFLGLIGGAAGATLVLPSPLARLLRPETALASLTSPTFPVDEAMAARILAAARSRGAAFADLYFETRSVSRLRLADGRIDSCEQGIFAGCGVRAVDGDRTGYAYADSFEEGPIVAAARDAAASAAGQAAAGAAPGFRRPETPSYVKVRVPFDTLPLDARVDWLERINKTARGLDPAVAQVTVELNDEMQRFLVISSDGVWAEDALPNLSCRVDVNASRDSRRGSGMERLGMRMGAEQMENNAPEQVAHEATRMAIAMLDAWEAPGGEMPVVLGAGGGVLFHEALGHGLEADAVHRGTSMFAGKVGQRVGSDRVTVVDSGAIPDLRGSYNVDDEGEPPHRNVLIEKGILRGFLNDRMSALALSAPRSGNGRRQSYRFPPLVRMSNTFLETGENTVEEIIRQTPRGLFARALGGGEVDPATGNFTFGVLEGYLIEDGRVTAPVRGATLVGNGPEIMERIDRVGPDQKFWNGTCGKGQWQWVPVTSGAPTLRISAMTVGGSGRA